MFRKLGNVIRELFGLLVVGVLASSGVHASCSSKCDEPSGWSYFQGVDIAVNRTQPDWKAQWRGQFDFENGDVRIDIERQNEGKPLNGTVALVGGRSLITRGFDSTRFDGEDLELPMLYMRLAMAVLGRGLPEGPSIVKNFKRIEVRNQKQGLRISTPGGVSLEIRPGWEAVGEIERGADNSFSFRFSLTGTTQNMFGEKDGELDEQISGRLRKLDRAVLPNDMSLLDWRTPNGEKSVSQMRAFVAEEFSVGVHDATRNFTGMWKEKCSDGFGLHIAPVGADGKYSISFCGPGGCFRPGTYRDDSFINEDKNYQIVSATEIRVRGEGKEFATYVRCNQDIKPPMPSLPAK